MPTGAVHVLFLSDRNAAYSLLAEAILRVEGNGRFRAFSAGLDPAAAATPEVTAFLAARHLPIDGLRPKSVAALEAEEPHFQFVIAVSPAAAKFARQHAWQGNPVVADWSLDEDEPSMESAPSPWAIRDAFWTLSRRIRIFASLPHRKATRGSLENRLHALQAG